MGLRKRDSGSSKVAPQNSRCINNEPLKPNFSLDTKSLPSKKKKQRSCHSSSNDNEITSTITSAKTPLTSQINTGDREAKQSGLLHQNIETAGTDGKNEKTKKKRKMVQNENELIKPKYKGINISETSKEINALNRAPEIENNEVLELDSNENRKDNNFANENDATEDQRTIYVGNLPLTYDKKKVIKLFTKFGPVEKARIRCVPVPNVGFPKKRAAITKTFHPQRSSLAAYVVFKLKDSVLKALSKNGMTIENHHLRIDYMVAQGKDVNKSVFVGGLPFDIEDDELWNFFKDCGEIDSVRVVRDRDIAIGKGFGYVNFKSTASVELALQLNGEELKNRKLNVQRCIHNKKKKFIRPFAIPNEKKIHKGNTKSCKSKTDYNMAKSDFQGKMSEQRQKKKKHKLTKEAIRKHKVISLLAPSSKKS